MKYTLIKGKRLQTPDSMQGSKLHEVHQTGLLMKFLSNQVNHFYILDGLVWYNFGVFKKFVLKPRVHDKPLRHGH